MSQPLTAEEVDALRNETPGVETVVHLNHAGASLPTTQVLSTQIAHLELEADIGGYEAARDRADDDAKVYDELATLIGAQPEEIARAEHATGAWNAGFWSLPMKPGQRILTAQAAYGANAVAFLRAVERRGITLEVIPDDDSGQIDLTELKRRIDDDVALVALTHVPTNGGLINPAAEVGAIANAAEVPYLLDACQSVGQLAIDVGEIGCDLLSATGRKYLRGPRGTGFLYASNRIVDRLAPDHPDHHGADWVEPRRFELAAGARRFEHWEYNHSAWLALGAAASAANTIGVDRIEATVIARAAALRAQLTNAGFDVFDRGQRHCGIVTTLVPGVEAIVVRDHLRARGINISVASAASARFDQTHQQHQEFLRISVHYVNTPAELAAAVDALSRL